MAFSRLLGVYANAMWVGRTVHRLYYRRTNEVVSLTLLSNVFPLVGALCIRLKHNYCYSARRVSDRSRHSQRWRPRSTYVFGKINVPRTSRDVLNIGIASLSDGPPSELHPFRTRTLLNTAILSNRRGVLVDRLRKITINMIGEYLYLTTHVLKKPAVGRTT
jgi:hypothetical protein